MLLFPPLPPYSRASNRLQATGRESYVVQGFKPNNLEAKERAGTYTVCFIGRWGGKAFLGLCCLMGVSCDNERSCNLEPGMYGRTL